MILKKLLSGVLAATLIAAYAAPVFAADTNISGSDASGSAYAASDPLPEETSDPRFEYESDGAATAITRTWDLGSYLVNDHTDELQAYDEQYVVDKGRQATVTNNRGQYNGSVIKNCYDGNWKTHWETGHNNDGNPQNNNYVEFEFPNKVTIGRIIFRARVEGAPGKGFPQEYRIYYQTEGENTYQPWAHGVYESVTTDPIEISFPEKTVKKLKFEYVRANDNWAAAAEFRFYRDEHARDDYLSMFLDGSCSALAYGVGIERVKELEKNLTEYPAPLDGLLKNYVDAALSTLKVPGRGDNISAPITMTQRGERGKETSRVGTTYQIGGQYDITELYARPNEKIGIFVNYDPNGPVPRVVFATANQDPWAWYKGYDGVALANGYNEIVCDGMKGCQLIYLYNPALPEDQAFPPTARIVGGTKYPVYRYDADHPENSESTEDFEKRLDEYLKEVTDIDAEAESGAKKFNV